MFVLVRKWIVLLKCASKNPKFKALNADGVEAPARLNNAEICIFDNRLMDKSISDEYIAKANKIYLCALIKTEACFKTIFS